MCGRIGKPGHSRRDVRQAKRAVRLH
jgi:hypothetical protein